MKSHYGTLIYTYLRSTGFSLLPRQAATNLSPRPAQAAQRYRFMQKPSKISPENVLQLFLVPLKKKPTPMWLLQLVT